MPASQDYSAWITRPKPSPNARLRLFCLPYAGGGASIYRTWPDILPPEIEVCPIQLPGREQRFNDPRFTDIRPLVDALGQELAPFLNTPFAFFGHSMGAIIGFELTRYLRRLNLPEPELLLVSAHRAPQIPDRREPIHQMPDREFIQELSLLKGMPDVVLANNDLVALMAPLLRADFAIAETYTYINEAPLKCPISVFGGLQDEGITKDDLTAWQKQTAAAFMLHMVNGDHFFFVKDRVTILRVIFQDLQRTCLR